MNGKLYFKLSFFLYANWANCFTLHDDYHNFSENLAFSVFNTGPTDYSYNSLKV